MNTVEFLSAVLPPDCIYFVAVPAPGGKGYKHYACDTIAEAASRAQFLDSEQKQNVYFACSGYRSASVMGKKPDGTPKTQYRVKTNVKAVKAFWLDLDVGDPEPGKPEKYPTQAEAVQALGKFVVAAGLPRPMVVSSGYGIHCYWPLTGAIMPGQWSFTAEALKALTVKLGLKADGSRTSDEASVLRPVGTHNRKVKNGVAGAAPVSCGSAVEPVEYAAFHAAVERAALKAGADMPGQARTSSDPVNPSGLIVPVGGFQKSSALRIATLCEQVRSFSDTGGASEPHWYAALQLVSFTDNGDKHVHEWSAKYGSYSQAETDQKLSQVRSFGPTTCSKFESVYPEGCRGCQYRGKITSPIQLGIEVRAAEAPKATIELAGVETVVELPQAPAPFVRGADDQPGLYMAVEGQPIRFYPYDLYPFELCKDVDMGYEITRVKHYLPHEGWSEFSFRSSLVSSLREFTTAMMDNSIKPENPKIMAAYMNSYLQELQNKTKIRKLYGSMGWKDDGFLLGKKMITKAGVQSAGVSNKVSTELVSSISEGGTLEGWQAGVKLFDQPQLEAHLFSFLVGFGAPLFALTGYDGCMLSMLGDTNSGKTLSSKAMLSIYGKYKGLRIGKKDTLNAKIEKMAMLGNLPVYIDELTNIEPEELSQFVYQVSEGRGRARLRSDASMREAAEWQTIGICSTNASLASKLAVGKDNAEAEMMRLLEYRVDKFSWFEPHMSALHAAVTDNYGHAGRAYIEWLVRSDRESLRVEMDKVIKSLMDAVSFKGKERFWINTVASVLYGAVAAQALGILAFDDFPTTYRRLFTWCCELIRASRGEAEAAKTETNTVIAQFLDAHVNGRLVVNESSLNGLPFTSVIKPPTGNLVMRYEQSHGKIYVDQKAIRKYLSDRQIDFGQLRRQLVNSGVVVDTSKKKVLGSGTTFAGGQIYAWVIDATHPELSGVEGAAPVKE